MKIAVENYFLESSRDGYIIYELGTVENGERKGEEFRKNERYYGKIEQACVRLQELIVNQSEVNNLESVIAEIKRAKTEIVTACNLRSL